MSVCIVFAGLVMLVVLPEGSERFQPVVDVFDEAALIVVDVNSGGDVHSGDQDHAVFDSGLLEGALDLRGQVNVGAFRFRMQGQVLGVEFHGFYLTTKDTGNTGSTWKFLLRIMSIKNYKHQCYHHKYHPTRFRTKQTAG